MNVEAVIERTGVPVVEHALPEGVRGTTGDVAGRRAIILNRNWRFSSENERRWVLAEELGHVLLEHQLVESTEPGAFQDGLLEDRRVVCEREARAFAAELLMPLAETRRYWLVAASGRFGPTGEASTDDIVRTLAQEFGVTPSAMRVRLRGLRLLAR